MTVLRYLKPFLLALTLLHLMGWTWTTTNELRASRDFLFANGTPVAGDFINMHAAARLTVAGDIPTIYDPDAFMAYERTIITQPIGLRLWAYPPHSLLAVWPFGLIGFYAGLAAWSLLGLIVLGRAPSDRYVPSADRLMQSVADACGPAALGVVLTGMGNDGARGTAIIKDQGGQAIAEAEETSVVFGMPKEAIATGKVDKVVPLPLVCGEILRRCGF